MLQLLSTTVAFVALWGLFWLTGVGLAGRSSSLPVRRAPILTPIVLGLAIWVLVLFLLASLQLLRPLPILLGALTLAGWGGSALGRWRLAAGPLLAASPDSTSSMAEPVARRILAVTLCVVAAVLFLETLHPGVSWDASAYHLTLPKLYLEHGGFFRVPLNVYSNWPLAIELLFALAMVIRDYVLAKTVHFGFALATLAVTYRVASRRDSPWTGLLAAALVLFNPVVLFEARIAYVDLAIAFFFVAGLAFLQFALESEQSGRAALLLSGLCCGLAAGAKLNGFFVAASLVLVLIVARRRTLRQVVLTELPWLVVPTALGLLPWLIKSALLVGNPVYPLLYSFFGGPEWSEELARQHATWQRSIGMGRGFVDYLLLPLRVILFGNVGYGSFDGRLHPTWIVWLPLAAVAGRTSALGRRTLGAAGVYFLLWSATSQQARLLIPILPLLGIAAALGASRLTCGLRRPAWSRVTRLGVSLVMGALLITSAWPWLQRAPRLALTLASHGDELREAVVPPTVRFVNDVLPNDACLLLLNTNQGFFLERPYLADSFFEASQISALLGRAQSSASASTMLRELGVTHLLLDRRSRGLVYPNVLDQLLHDRTLVAPLYTSPDGRFVVLALR